MDFEQNNIDVSVYTSKILSILNEDLPPCLLGLSSKNEHKLKESMFLFQLVEGGISNKLVKVTNKSDHNKSCLFKFSDEKPSNFIRNFELMDISNYVRCFDLGKEIYMAYQDIIVEEWIKGSSLSLEEMKDEQFFPLIAQKIALLHSLPLPDLFSSDAYNAEGEHTDTKQSLLWHKIWGYYKICCSEAKNQLCRCKSIQLLDFKAIEKALEIVEEAATQSYSPVVLSHCDLLCGNIIHTYSRNVTFIDFEYCIPAERAFDIANHFNEYIGFECDWSRFPSQEHQLEFLEHYLSHSDNPKTTPQLLSREIQPFFLASHAYWGLWSIVQAAQSSIDFDYFIYGVKRLSALFDRLDLSNPPLPPRRKFL